MRSSARRYLHPFPSHPTSLSSIPSSPPSIILDDDERVRRRGRRCRAPSSPLSLGFWLPFRFGWVSRLAAGVDVGDAVRMKYGGTYLAQRMPFVCLRSLECALAIMMGRRRWPTRTSDWPLCCLAQPLSLTGARCIAHRVFVDVVGVPCPSSRIPSSRVPVVALGLANDNDDALAHASSTRRISKWRWDDGDGGDSGVGR